MENTAKLKDIRDEKIYINDDTTMNQRGIEKTIKKITQEQRDNGKRSK